MGTGREGDKMTTFRMLRFPILIGACIAAAGLLYYFTNSRVSREQTQGAIGQRDVYRDGAVKASDVGATPGSAPVAISAILQSKEFSSLAKNASFQSLMSSASFQELSKQAAFVSLLSDGSFQATV